MTLSELLTRWFDVRPGEGRRVVLSFLGAFSVMAFLILAKALRTTFFVTTFNVENLPYMTIAVAVLTLPTVGLFARGMGRGNPHAVYSGFLVGLAAVIAGFFFFTPAGTAPDATNSTTRVATVAFYLITVLGASLLTSGFWVVTSEHFSLRQAKRVFGLVGAGGTLGAMLAGLSVSWLTRRFTTLQLVPGLILLLAAVLILQRMMPRLAPYHHQQDDARGTPVREALELILGRPHLRNIALIVFIATMASTILEYQFVEVVSRNYGDTADMASFFAAFYGWTGVIALLIQVFLAARLMRGGRGITLSLAVLPALLLAGSTAMLLVSFTIGTTFLWTTTATRGADNSLRKSLHRSVLEYLYVPIPPEVRRKTKTFIDSIVDSVAGGVGAAVLSLWLNLAGLPSRWLSILVGALSIAFIYAARRTGAQYRRTVRDQLAAGDVDAVDTSGFDARNLLTVTLTRLDLQNELAKAGIDLGRVSEDEVEPGLETTLVERISSSDAAVVQRALDEHDEWDEGHVPHLTRLLARTDLYTRAMDALLSTGDAGTRHLIDVLLDESADFVIRRRTPRILSEIDTAEADQALVDALAAGRFEVRYRAAVALARRRKGGLATASGDWQRVVWEAIERELSRDRPIWELQKILDGAVAGEDDFVGQRVDVRGELSLEHTFRKLSLVLDPEPVKMAFHGIIMDDENLKSLALEYLEQVLPPPIRQRLWPFIGDISEYQREKSIRPFSEVVDELSQTGVTLFGGASERAALRDALKTYDDEKAGNDDDER